MATNASIGKGLQLKRGDGESPETFNLIAEITSIGGLGSEASLEEATHFQSLAKEYILGLTDGVEFPLTCNFLPDDSTQDDVSGLIADHNDRRQVNFQMSHPDWNKAFTFTGLVRKWGLPETTPSGVMHNSFAIKVSGAIVYEVVA